MLSLRFLRGRIDLSRHIYMVVESPHAKVRGEGDSLLSAVPMSQQAKVLILIIEVKKCE